MICAMINSRMLSALRVVLLAGIFTTTAAAQTVAPVKSVAPAKLPGKGLKQFDFFYAGEAKSRNMYIIRNGQVTWSYIDTIGKGEISDAHEKRKCSVCTPVWRYFDQ
jgi:hypothetical protein